MDRKSFLGGFLLLLAASLAHAVDTESLIVSVSTYGVSATTGSVDASTSTIVDSSWTWRSSANNAFKVGEELSFVLKWGVITGGHASLAIPNIDMINNRPAYHLVSGAHSAGIVNAFYKTQDKNESWIDVQSLSTVRFEKHIREGKYQIDESVDFDQPNHVCRDFSHRLDKGTTEYVEIPIPSNTMDVFGSLYFVRTLPLEVGQSYTFEAYDGKKVWPLVVKVEKRETVKVAAGKFDCFRVEPILRQPGIFVNKGKKLQVWLTADESHMPVLMRSEVFIGHVAAELTHYHLGVSSSPPTP